MSEKSKDSRISSDAREGQANAHGHLQQRRGTPCLRLSEPGQAVHRCPDRATTASGDGKRHERTGEPELLSSVSLLPNSTVYCGQTGRVFVLLSIRDTQRVPRLES